MSNADLKDVVRESWASLDEEKGPGKIVAKMLGISEVTVSGFVSDLLAKRREDRRAKAIRLSMLGWTQEEIGERLSISQDTISLDTKKFNSEDSRIFDSGHLPEEISFRFGRCVQNDIMFCFS